MFLKTEEKSLLLNWIYIFQSWGLSFWLININFNILNQNLYFFKRIHTFIRIICASSRRSLGNGLSCQIQPSRSISQHRFQKVRVHVKELHPNPKYITGHHMHLHPTLTSDPFHKCESVCKKYTQIQSTSMDIIWTSYAPSPHPTPQYVGRGGGRFFITSLRVEDLTML